jgi:hypothetical protein
MADYDPDSDTLSTSQGEYELEKVWEDLRFVALTKGLTIQHKGWALEEMEGPGQVAPDPMRFDGQAYTPATKTEAKELLLHEQKRGNTGGTNLFYLAPIEDVDVAGEEGNEPTGSGELEALTTEDRISNRQEALEALSAAGVDVSTEGAPTPSSPKADVLAFAHDKGYRFPNYE